MGPISLPNVPNLDPNMGASPLMGGSPMAAQPVAPVAPMRPQMPPPQVTAQPPAQATTEQPNRLGEIFAKALPVIASFIAQKQGGPLASAAALNGFAARQKELHDEEAQRLKVMADTQTDHMTWGLKQQEHTDTQNARLANFVADISEKLAGIDDPATFASVRDLADDTAVQAFGVQPGFIKGRVTINPSIGIKKDKAEAEKVIERLQRQYGDQYADLVSSGATVPWKDGRKSVKELASLAGLDVQAATGGQSVLPTPKEPVIDDEKSFVAAAVVEARRQAKEKGKTWTGQDALTAAENATRRYYGLKHTGASQGGSGEGSVTGNDTDIRGDMQDILEGRNTIFNIRQTMGRSNSAASYMKKLRGMIRAIDPKFDFVASDAGGKSVSSSYVQRAVAAINSVLPNIDTIVNLSNQVSRLGVRGVDDLLQRGAIQIGNKKVANFRQAQKLIADEIGVALGAGTVSDMKLQLGFDVTDPAVTPEVFASNMAIVKEFIENRRKGLESLRYKSDTSDKGETVKTVEQAGVKFKVTYGKDGKVISSEVIK